MEGETTRGRNDSGRNDSGRTGKWAKRPVTYPAELQLIKIIRPIPKRRFLDLNLSIFNGIFSTKIYDKRDDFDFDIVNFRFLDGNVPRSTSTYSFR